MPRPSCLSPAANSLDSRIAGCQVPRPSCLSPAANSLDSRIAGCQVPRSARKCYLTSSQFFDKAVCLCFRINLHFIFQFIGICHHVPKCEHDVFHLYLLSSFSTPPVNAGSQRQKSTPEVNGGRQRRKSTPEVSAGSQRRKSTPEVNGRSQRQKSTPECLSEARPRPDKHDRRAPQTSTTEKQWCSSEVLGWCSSRCLSHGGLRPQGNSGSKRN